MRATAAVFLTVLPVWGQLSPQDQEGRQILKQLIEINTTDSAGDNTRAAEAMAARFREAGYPETDIRVLGPAPREGFPDSKRQLQCFRDADLGAIGHTDLDAARQAPAICARFVLCDALRFRGGPAP